MTTLIHRSEAKNILETCEISGYWRSPYSPVQDDVPLVTVAERFLLTPECLSLLLAAHSGDDEDFIALRALADCKDYYWQDDPGDQSAIDSSFEILREWVAEATTTRLIARFTSTTSRD